MYTIKAVLASIWSYSTLDAKWQKEESLTDEKSARLSYCLFI
jgi:hypothetical protein